jgi:hypothetical protein
MLSIIRALQVCCSRGWAPFRIASRIAGLWFAKKIAAALSVVMTIPGEFARWFCSVIASVFHDKVGATATMLAIALPGLIGIGALGAETGAWFTVKLQNQAAADSAAIAAAYEVIAGKTDVSGDLTMAADETARAKRL